MAKREWNIVRHSGETGSRSVESTATTSDRAREIAQAERNQLMQGSSDYFTVERRTTR